MNDKSNLSQGPIIPVLIKFTIPIFLAALLQATYGTVDLWVVARFADVADTSAVTIGSQIIFIITGLCIGLAMGTTIMLGEYIGAGKGDRAAHTLGCSIAIFATLAVLLTAGLIGLSGQIATLCKTPEEAVTQTCSYLVISGIGATFIMAYNLLGSVFRGLGDSKTPLIAVGIACTVNVFLDLLLVAVFQMGATGAALATVVSQGISVLLSFLVIKRQKLPFVFPPSYIKFNPAYTKRLVRLGIPMAFQSLVTSLSFLAITAIINMFGVYASSAGGIVMKISIVLMLLPSAFMQALAAFTAQNRGAGKPKRGRQGLVVGLCASVLFSTAMAYISIWHGEILVGIFSTDPLLMEPARILLNLYAVEGILVAGVFSMMGYFNGCGRTRFVMGQAVLSSLLVRLPLAIFLSQMEGATVFSVGLGIPISSAVQVIACVIYYLWYQKALRTGKLSECISIET